jgi:hypothetical protein
MCPEPGRGYGAFMTSSTLHRPGIDHGGLLPVFAIRAELDPVADRATMREFARQVEDGIRAAAESGSFEEINKVLREWLGIALTAQNLGAHVALDRAARRANLDTLVERWVQVNVHAA